MSFLQGVLEKISKNKILVGTVCSLAAVAFICYKVLNQQGSETRDKNQQSEVDKQIEKLKKKINIHNLSIGDLKQILIFTMQLTQKKLADQQNIFKAQRRKLKDKGFAEYLKTIVEGLLNMQELSVKCQNQVLEKLNLSERQFQQLCMKNPAAFQTIPQPKRFIQYKQLSINEIKEVFKFQKQYLQEKGQEICTAINNQSVGWNEQMKYMIPGVLSLIIADQIYTKFGFEDQQVEQSSIKYQLQLMNQLNEVRKILVPLLTQFTQGMGNYGNPLEQFDPSMVGGYDPHLMEGFDPNLDPQIMQQIQQMQGDPQMMAKLMAMMQQR